MHRIISTLKAVQTSHLKKRYHHVFTLKSGLPCFWRFGVGSSSLEWLLLPSLKLLDMENVEPCSKAK